MFLVSSVFIIYKFYIISNKSNKYIYLFIYLIINNLLTSQSHYCQSYNVRQ